MRKLLVISVIILAIVGCHVQKKSKPCVQCPHYSYWPMEVIINYHTLNVSPQFAKK